MPRYSVNITTTREVVVNAKDLEKAHTKALRYARDVFPTCTPHVITSSTQAPPFHVSKTHDDADDIPRDA